VKHYATIDFIPVPAGAAGLWETIIGAVLVIVGVVLVIVSEGTLAQIGVYAIMAGVGLMAGGIMQMFFGPKPPVTSSHDQTDRGNGKDMSSYLFSGPVNTIAQGGPVPLLFGHMIVGSQTISMSIRTASTTVGGDQPGSDAFRQEIADAMNMGTIAAKTTRDTTEKLIRGESTDDSGS
jgi:predicted phage tail protein